MKFSSPQVCKEISRTVDAPDREPSWYECWNKKRTSEKSCQGYEQGPLRGIGEDGELREGKSMGGGGTHWIRQAE